MTNFLRIISEVGLTPLGFAVLLIAIHVLTKCARYQYILVRQGVRIPFYQTVRLSLAGIYLSFVTPGRVGEVSKAYFIHKVEGTPLNRLFAGAIVDRLFDVYTLLIIAFGGFFLVPGLSTPLPST